MTAPLLTAAEVAELLALSLTKVYELARRGSLAHFRFGGAVRFDLADVEAYKQSCKHLARLPQARALTVATAAVSKPASRDLLGEFNRAGVKPGPTPRRVPTPRKARPKPVG